MQTEIQIAVPVFMGGNLTAMAREIKGRARGSPHSPGMRLLSGGAGGISDWISGFEKQLVRPSRALVSRAA